ncbi:MAG: hypothetical protein WCY19_01155 [Candidatus Gastranaerophilaceae bacterium]
MTNISSITNSINEPIGKFMNYTTRKWFAKTLEKGYKEPAKYAAKMMVLSIVSKDAINCAIYTYQSYNNKEIPERKRKFIAAMDLINGIINVGGQILSFMLIERLLTPILESKYTGIFKDPKTEVERLVKSDAALAPDHVYELAQNIIKEKQAELKKIKDVNIDDVMKNIKVISKDVVEKLSQTKGKDLATGLSLLVGALGTMALVKRTITPLVSTPLAGLLSDRWDKKENDKKEHKMDAIESENLYKNPTFKNFNLK